MLGISVAFCVLVGVRYALLAIPIPSVICCFKLEGCVCAGYSVYAAVFLEKMADLPFVKLK